MSEGWPAPRGLADGVDEQPVLPGLERPLPGQERLAPLARHTRRRLARAAIIGCGLLIVCGLGVLGYVAWSNYDRANRWEARAARLQRNVVALNDVLIARSATLNARTRELNSLAHKLRLAQRNIARSEADVGVLEERQRQLANEKAQVEDARAALQGVASAYVQCKNGLLDLLRDVANQDYYSARSYVDQVDADCQYADDALDTYLSTYTG